MMEMNSKGDSEAAPEFLVKSMTKVSNIFDWALNRVNSRENSHPFVYFFETQRKVIRLFEIMKSDDFEFKPESKIHPLLKQNRIDLGGGFSEDVMMGLDDEKIFITDNERV